MKGDLVSIITPCYNGEKYIHRLLESVLEQTYKDIELLIIDDGSTDSTKDIVESYHDRFKTKEIKLVYVYQKNSGQAEAINTGLKIMTGEYLTWVDSDDFLEKASVEKRVELLKENGEGHFTATQYKIVEENNLEKVLKIKGRKKPLKTDNFFYDLIWCRNIVFAGGIMLKTRDFLKICKEKEIYSSREGQNWQLMLPITYFYKCIYIKEPLYTVVVYPDSHSRSKRTKDQKVQRCLNFIELLENTIKKMNILDEEIALEEVYKKQIKDIVLIAKQYRDKELEEEYYSFFKKKYGEKKLELLKKSIKNKWYKEILQILKSNKIIRKFFKNE